MEKQHIKGLNDAFISILDKPSKQGSMAYVRCLPPEIIYRLCGENSLSIPGWDIFVVSSDKDLGRGSYFITADKAVDLREKKRGNILLFVDAKEAGAGMDGIYSAAREIQEKELFNATRKDLSRLLSKKRERFILKALQSAKQLGKRHSISPWQEFDFYSRCISDTPEDIGANISLIGLWPIAADSEENLSSEDIETSALMVERTLLASNKSSTIRSRIDSLMLPQESENEIALLEDLLGKHQGNIWTEVLADIAANYKRLWLNRLKPGFNKAELNKIELMPWRGRKNEILKWSGLGPVPNEDIPVFYIPENEDDSRLEVRWKTLPLNLPANSVEYNVSITTGSNNELITKSVSHTGKNYEKCVFTWEDFQTLPDREGQGGKWEVVIRVNKVGAEQLQPGEDSPLWKETESFILTFGNETGGPTTESVTGKKSRALVESAIYLDVEQFTDACTGSCNESTKGDISYRVGSKKGSVYRPPLLKKIEESWLNNGLTIGRWSVRVREDGSLMENPSFISLESLISDEKNLKKLKDPTRTLASQAVKRCGFMGIIHRENRASTDYVNAWISILDDIKEPELCLAHTLEVQHQSGGTIGIIVLPLHPIRVAWHQAYDELAYHARYNENLTPKRVIEALETLDGSYFPMFLPGLNLGESFIFGDTLAFYSAAMIRATEREPQAAIALMARCFGSIDSDIAPTLSSSTSSAIAREITRYCELHSKYRLLKINAVHPGDGLTVIKSLGKTLQKRQNSNMRMMKRIFLWATYLIYFLVRRIRTAFS